MRLGVRLPRVRSPSFPSKSSSGRGCRQDLCRLFDGFEAELAAERRQTLIMQPGVSVSRLEQAAGIEEARAACSRKRARHRAWTSLTEQDLAV